MKITLKILFIILCAQVFGQKNNSDYSKEILYRKNIDVIIYANDENSDFNISLLGENIMINNDDENQIQIRTNKEKHKLLIDVLKEFNPSNEIYDEDGKIVSYKTNTKSTTSNNTNAVLVFEVYYFSICSDINFIYIFDLDRSIKILNHLSEIYKNKNQFKKLIRIIKNHN